MRKMLSKEDIVLGLRKIDEMAKRDGVVVDLSIYGGAALALAFDMRSATRDVDAVIKNHSQSLREYIMKVSEELEWPEDWLNDGVKGFVSASEKMNAMQEFNPTQEGGLRISLPTGEYLFAMKCMAMRPEGVDGSHDISDIEGLAKELGIKNADEAFAIIEAFYPKGRIPSKVMFGVEEIFENIEEKRRLKPS